MDEIQLKQQLRQRMASEFHSEPTIESPAPSTPLQQPIPSAQTFQQTEQVLRQQPIAQQTAQQATNPAPVKKKSGMRWLWNILKLAIIVGFFYGAYLVLDRLGIIQQIKDGLLLYIKI